MSLQTFDSSRMVTQIYTFNPSGTKHKGLQTSSSLPYVGFPGLSLTPIPESPLLDSLLDEAGDSAERRLADSVAEEGRWSPSKLRTGSLPQHWRSDSKVTVERGQGGAGKAACSLNVHVVHTTTLLPKEAPMTGHEKRSHLIKLLLFALCGFVIVAGIVLWIFSPTFT